jgi:hypothetical protein
MNESLEAQAKYLDEVVGELEKAIAHAKTASAHFRSGEVPRGCAHSLVVEGHTVVATGHLHQVAKAHRLAARI